MPTGEIQIFSGLPTCVENAGCLRQCGHNKLLVLVKGDKTVL